MLDAEEETEAREEKGRQWLGPGQPTGHRNKFSCKANVDYPTVNVPGNYISREEADCYCFYLRPSTPPSSPSAFSPFLHFAILCCPILPLPLSLSRPVSSLS